MVPEPAEERGFKPRPKPIAEPVPSKVSWFAEQFIDVNFRFYSQGKRIMSTRPLYYQ